MHWHGPFGLVWLGLAWLRLTGIVSCLLLVHATSLFNGVCALWCKFSLGGFATGWMPLCLYFCIFVFQMCLCVCVSVCLCVCVSVCLCVCVSGQASKIGECAGLQAKEGEQVLL